jgi:AcrR family transcriptional regulator
MARMSDDDPVRTGRDAVLTRAALVRAARRRFAVQGFRATTVRDIAADAGVNVALINRYFGSKDGLFEACMRGTIQELGPAEGAAPVGVEGAIRNLVDRIAHSPDVDEPLQLLLLLRSSGDEEADAIRRRTLASFGEQLAGLVAPDPAQVDDDALLRAQIAIATLLGMVMIRSTTGLEPMTSADADRLDGPLGEAFAVLLRAPRPDAGAGTTG